MVHSQTIKELTEDELLLLWGVMSHIYGLMGMECKYKWLQMVKVTSGSLQSIESWPKKLSNSLMDKR